MIDMSILEKTIIYCLNRSCVSLGKVPLPLGQKPWNVCLRLLLWTPAYWQGYVKICTHEDFEFAMYCTITLVSASSYPLYFTVKSAFLFCYECRYFESVLTSFFSLSSSRTCSVGSMGVWWTILLAWERQLWSYWADLCSADLNLLSSIMTCS